MDTVLEVGKKMLLCLILFVVWLVAPAVCYVVFLAWVFYMSCKLIYKCGYRYLVFLSNINFFVSMFLFLFTLAIIAACSDSRHFDALGHFISPMDWFEKLINWLPFGFFVDAMICAIAYGVISMAIMYVFYVRVLKD